MTKYTIPVDVTRVDGQQIYSVEADTPEEAIAILKSGGGKLEEEELDVQDLDFEAISVDDLWFEELLK